MPADGLGQPVLTAADLLAKRRAQGAVFPAAPEAALLCYARPLLEHFRRRHLVQPVRGFLGEAWLLKRPAGRLVVVGGFGVGAPATAVLAEDLVAWGVRRLVSVGVAGGLAPNLSPGAVVVVARALRDEGVSRHYLPAGESIAAQPDVLGGLLAALAARGLAAAPGLTWTMDAPYRELRGEVQKHQAAGVATVEMEAAALLAVSQALGVAAGAALVVADTLVDGRWRLDIDQRRVDNQLREVLEAAVDYLTR